MEEHMNTGRKWLMPLLLVVSLLVLTQCGAPSTPAPTTAPAPATAAPTAPPAAPTQAATTAAVQPPAGQDYTKAERKETVIFDIDGGRVADPKQWNFYLPGARRDHGYHQSVIEPLFVLNYETGKIDSWLGLSMTANATQDVWTLKLRPGVKWSDGIEYNADDVVFTIEMLLKNSPELTWSAGLKEWIKSVKKVDNLTVEFTLNKSNPRFQLDNFSVRIWGGPDILPKHIWEGKDPKTFTNYDPAKGWPVFTGPYKLANVSETEFVYVRDDNWWGAKAGFKPLPLPKKLVWTWFGPEETRAAALADNKLDSLMDVTLGAFQAIKQRNPKVLAYYDKPPFAWVPDPCSRTLEFNVSQAPWNDKDLRWAVNYAIDRDQIVKIAYEGSTFASRHFFPAYAPLNRLVDLLQSKGLYDKYPLLKKDPAKAQQLIESKGWKKVGNYYEKDGKQLALDITTHEAFIEKQRIAQVEVEELQKVGINASTRNEAGNTWEENFALGKFQAKMGWQTCGSVNEPWASMDTMNVKWLKPVGERANGDQWRWSGPAAEQYSKLVDQIGTLPLGDPKIDDLFVQAMDIWFAELPVIPITQAKKIIPFNSTYWTNWPDAKNNYIHPPTWWEGNTELIILSLKPAGPS
jgi:peptide/nickel transport system substrate-binding protein